MKELLRKILLSLASVFLMWQSVKLVLNLQEMQVDSWAFALFLAWLITLFITGIFAFAGFAFPTQKLLPEPYYEIHQPRKVEQWCRVLKVNWFRYMLLATLWKNKKQRKQFFNGKKAGIVTLIRQSKKSEFGHLIPFILISFLVIYLLVIGLYLVALFAMLINIVGNAYPILLQRHHRMRIERIGRIQRHLP